MPKIRHFIKDALSLVICNIKLTMEYTHRIFSITKLIANMSDNRLLVSIVKAIRNFCPQSPASSSIACKPDQIMVKLSSR